MPQRDILRLYTEVRHISSWQERSYLRAGWSTCRCYVGSRWNPLNWLDHLDSWLSPVASKDVGYHERERA